MLRKHCGFAVWVWQKGNFAAKKTSLRKKIALLIFFYTKVIKI